jgi:hypothetical protein
MKVKPKFLLDMRKDKVYSARTWDKIIALHVAAHPGVKSEDCAGCRELAERMRFQETTIDHSHL